MKIKIGVVYGGISVEHEVSIISALQAIKNLDESKYEVIPIYISKEGEWFTGPLLTDIKVYKDLNELKRYSKNVVLTKINNEFVLVNKKGLRRIVNSIDFVLPIVHGTNVEDGTLAAYLEMVGVPYAESNLFASSIGQDKVFQKQIFSSSNIPVTDYYWFFDYEYKIDEKNILDNINKLGYPVIVKPARLGSSVGISKVKNSKEIRDSIEEAIKYDEKILVEKVVENLIEVNCSVLGNYETQEASLLEEVMGCDEFLSYKDKYIGGAKTKGSKGMSSTNRILPARLDEKTTKEVQEISKKAFKVLNNNGVVRIDYLIDKKTNKIYLNEVNTIPGSLSYYLWEKSGKTYKDLLNDIISLGIKKYKKNKNKVYSFDTNILSNYNGSKGSKGKLK